MLEHRRQHYLSLLGIENYMPTHILPSAAPSVLMPDELLVDPATLSLALSTPVHDSSEQHSLEPHSESEFIAQVPSDESNTSDHLVAIESATIPEGMSKPLDVLGGVGEGINALNRDLPVNEQLNVDSSEQAEQRHHSPVSIKFIFSVWRIQDVLILDTRKVREALPTDRLLQNILRAVGYPTAQLPASESLRWPLFTNKRFANTRKESTDTALGDEHYKGDKEQARAMVQAYISAQHSKAPLKYLLLMGNESTEFTLAETTNADSTIGTMNTTALWDGVQCFSMPSLYAMLQDPPSKRIAWQALQFMNNDTE